MEATLSEATPLNAPLPRAAHAIEQAFYQVKYAVAHLARSTTGEHRLMRPDEALRNIAAIEGQLSALKALLVADDAAREAERAEIRAAQAERDKAAAAEAKRLERNAARRRARAPKTVEAAPAPAVIMTAVPVDPVANVYAQADTITAPRLATVADVTPLNKLKRFFKKAA